MRLPAAIKICFIADPGSVHMQRWINFFVKKGYEISVISYNRVHGRPLDPCVKVFDLTQICNGRKVRYLIWAAVIRKIIRQAGPDILHAHNVAGAGWLGLFSRFHPFVVTAHGSDMMLMPYRSFLFRKLNTIALGCADRVTAGSWALYDRCLANGACASRTEQVVIGTDTDVFQRKMSRLSACRELGLDSGPVIFFIRSIREIYNPDILIDAMPGLAKQFTGIRFLFPTGNGDPCLLEIYKKKIQTMGLAASVVFLDPVKDDAQMAVWYMAADICVSIPSSDGVSIAVLEAMSCATPVVMTDLPAYTDGFFQDQSQVVKIPVNDSQVLADTLMDLLVHEKKMQQIGQKAREAVCRYADHRRAMYRIDEIYQSLVSP